MGRKKRSRFEEGAGAACPRGGCANGGRCVRVRRSGGVCACAGPWGGARCALYVGHDHACRERACAPPAVCLWPPAGEGQNRRAAPRSPGGRRSAALSELLKGARCTARARGTSPARRRRGRGRAAGWPRCWWWCRSPRSRPSPRCCTCTGDDGARSFTRVLLTTWRSTTPCTSPERMTSTRTRTPAAGTTSPTRCTRACTPRPPPRPPGPRSTPTCWRGARGRGDTPRASRAAVTPPALGHDGITLGDYTTCVQKTRPPNTKNETPPEPPGCHLHKWSRLY